MTSSGPRRHLRRFAERFWYCVSPWSPPSRPLLPLSFATAQGSDRVRSPIGELSNAAGAPGFEEGVRRIMVREMKPYGAIRYDGLGSVIVQNGSGGPRVMLDAHMDELGGVVRRITDGGFLSMQMLGGWLDQALPDQRWIIIGSKGPVLAVTGIRDIHYTPTEERTKVMPGDQIFLDVGAKSAADATRLGLEPGDPVVPYSPFAPAKSVGLANSFKAVASAGAAMCYESCTISPGV